ncbi:hypothetical protein FA95DRAFT_686892 [Auriscalpium vulgare]|uniref:Uncharacterized protein n=1 Tax=Auriscalpium vulgare TaxID=40419 RepID=A0ACB8S1Y7_9AGAM|nr:hypothetical protein FA95DRAFT_686892 [Auriscalpium vulgare]
MASSSQPGRGRPRRRKNVDAQVDTISFATAYPVGEGSKPRASATKSSSAPPPTRHNPWAGFLPSTPRLKISMPITAKANESDTDDEEVKPSPAASSAKKAKVNNTIRPSERMSEFLDNYAVPIHSTMLEGESGPPSMSCAGANCASGTQVHEELFKCEECFFTRFLCAACIQRSHADNPFHRILAWRPNTGFWRRHTLCEVGMVVHLGHDGASCSNSTDNPRHMTLGLESGFQAASVKFCGCRPSGRVSAVPHFIQLLRHGLFPASWQFPKSAFSIRLHKTFHLLSLQAQTNARDFILYLRRKTDNVMMSTTPDRYREFLTSAREFAYLRTVRRAGVLPVRNMEAGSLAVLCPACPQPDINMDPRWRERPLPERFLDALFYTIDGNFHQNQRLKPHDPDDFPLTLGAAYFAHEEDFAKYQQKLGPLELEETTCHKFAALGYGGYWGNVSGTVGVSCARHMFVLPGGGVDLQKGERFANVDFAMVSALQRWTGLLMHVSGYDINCQYQRNLDKRLREFNMNTVDLKRLLTVLLPITLRLVGKFHLPAHIKACRAFWGFNNAPGVGRTDGEALERLWALLNLIGAITREMNSGYRHDKINDHHGDMNARRVHGIVKATVKKHTEAVKHHGKVTRHLALMERAIPADTLSSWIVEKSEWEALVVDPQNHKNMSNPFDPQDAKMPTQNELVASMTAMGKTAAGTTVRPGLVGAIGEGIELQAVRAELLSRLADPWEADADDTIQMLQGFWERLRTWQEIATIYLTPFINAALAGGAPNPLLASEDDEDEDDEGEYMDTDAEASDDEEVDTPMGSKRAASLGGNSQRGASSGNKRAAAKRAASAGSKRAGRSAVRRPRKRPNGVNSDWDEVDKVVILLPSSVAKGKNAQADLGAAWEVEYALRRGEANDTLDNARNLLITGYALKRHRRHEHGQKHNTRGKRVRGLKMKLLNRVVTRYRASRRCLLLLGMPQDDDTYRALKNKDIKAFTVFTDDEILGDGKSEVSWLWDDLGKLSEMDDDAVQSYCAEAQKVYWFRRHSLQGRWQEELLLVEEEMRRIVRFFDYYITSWGKTAAKHDGDGTPSLAAYARRQQFRYQQLLDDALSSFPTEVVSGVLSAPS